MKNSEPGSAFPKVLFLLLCCLLDMKPAKAVELLSVKLR